MQIDDCTILESGNGILVKKLNSSVWLKDQYLELSPGKSSVPINQLCTREVNAQLCMTNRQRFNPVKQKPQNPRSHFHLYAHLQEQELEKSS